MNISGRNLEEIFVNSLKELDSKGSFVENTIELLGVNFIVEDPRQIVINNEHRKFKKDYGIIEWLWYLSTDKNVRNIGKYASIWNRIKDDNGEVESNYGTLLKPQWKWVISELKNNSNSRRATIAINNMFHKFEQFNEKDFPCTQYLQFFIRDKKLHLIVNMRSNDCVFGFCNDVFTFSLFQQMMLNELKIQNIDVSLGNYYHFAGSFHIYEMHYGMMKKILNSNIDISEEKIELKDYVTWDYIDDNNLSLPKDDISIEEMKKIALDIQQNLFVS